MIIAIVAAKSRLCKTLYQGSVFCHAWIIDRLDTRWMISIKNDQTAREFKSDSNLETIIEGRRWEGRKEGRSHRQPEPGSQVFNQEKDEWEWMIVSKDHLLITNGSWIRGKWRGQPNQEQKVILSAYWKAVSQRGRRRWFIFSINCDHRLSGLNFVIGDKIPESRHGLASGHWLESRPERGHLFLSLSLLNKLIKKEEEAIVFRSKEMRGSRSRSTSFWCPFLLSPGTYRFSLWFAVLPFIRLLLLLLLLTREDNHRRLVKSVLGQGSVGTSWSSHGLDPWLNYIQSLCHRVSSAIILSTFS